MEREAGTLTDDRALDRSHARRPTGFRTRLHGRLERRRIIKILSTSSSNRRASSPSNLSGRLPWWLAPKSDGTLRFCVDYRRLNALTIKDTYPISRMDDCIDSIWNSRLFTTLGCNSGYHQVSIRPEDREKTTFTCNDGSFQWKRRPFGLKNTPTPYQLLLDILLSGYRWRTCLVNLDDVIIFSRTFEDHFFR